MRTIYRLQVFFLSRSVQARIYAPECRFCHGLQIKIVNHLEIQVGQVDG